MTSSSYTTLINISLEHDKQGLWVLTSKDLPGLLLAGKELENLFNDVPNAIKLLYQVNYGMNVSVTPVLDDGAGMQPNHQLIPAPTKFVTLRAA